MNREDLMHSALAQANQAMAHGEIPVGAVIVYDGEIIAAAHNEREGLCDPTAHAEVLAIRRAAQRLGRRRLHGCTMYVTLEPCPMCAGTIVMSGLDEVIFGAYDREAGCTGSVYNLPEDGAFMHPVPCSGGLLEKECADIIAGFFERRRSEKDL